MSGSVRGVDGARWPRLLPIASSHNLRDMGGYRTADGRVIKWRHLYRSGVMTCLDEADQARFGELGVVAICDLRGEDERRQQPTEWHLAFDIQYWTRDYNLSIGSLHDMFRRGSLAPDAVLAFIHDVYRLLPYEQAESYRELFRRLGAGDVPLLFNCSAGKDRTGIAAALILSALNVPRATIAEDYALSDEAIEQLITIFLEDPKYASLAALPRENYLPMLRADPAYLDIMFDEIESRHGSVAGYLREVLGVGDAEISAIRDVLLEDPATEAIPA